MLFNAPVSYTLAGVWPNSRRPRGEEARLTEQQRGGGCGLPVLARTRAERGAPGHRRRGDAVPEFLQPRDAMLRRVAGDDGGVHRPDGDAGDPVRRVFGCRERLIHPGLVAAERAAALQDQRDLLVVGGRPRWCCRSAHGRSLRRIGRARRRHVATIVFAATPSVSGGAHSSLAERFQAAPEPPGGVAPSRSIIASASRFWRSRPTVATASTFPSRRKRSTASRAAMSPSTSIASQRAAWPT